MSKNYKASLLWRFTLIHTSIVVMLCALTLWLVSYFSLGYSQQRQNTFVLGQLSTLKQHAVTADRKSFLKEIDWLARDSSQVLVVLKSADKYFGNLNYLPDRVPQMPEIGSFMIFGNSALGNGRLQKVRGSQIDTRWGKVLVAYNSSDFNVFAARFKLAVYGAIFLALIAGLVTGTLFSRKVLGRLNEINKMTRQVKSGDLSARVAVSSRNDEFDELADHINGMLSRIEDSVGALRTVTDSIAHDLRTPLSRLKIGLDQWSLNDAKDMDRFSKLQSELDTILHTFNSMLELTRLEQGQNDILFETCSLTDICRDVIELAEPLAEDREQMLTLDTGGDTVINGNRQLLFRAVFNLVENAIKYAPEKSPVKVAVAQGQVLVIDTGKGIPEHEQEKVFRRLYRLDQSRSTAGYGLGLSLVKAVAELHAATITFEVQENTGFIARLSFPLS